MKPVRHDSAYFDHWEALLRQPMTPAETARFRSQIAAQMAEDERRRAPVPQLPLPVAA
jgi:hypothetical protein